MRGEDLQLVSYPSHLIFAVYIRAAELGGKMATEDWSNFQFICVQSLDVVGDRKAKRLARSHAIKRALENKRKLQQRSGHNFRITSLNEHPRRKVAQRTWEYHSTLLTSSPTAGLLNPFQMLAADSSRLRTWLTQHEAHKPAEPIFSISDELVLRNYRSIIQSGVDDPALLNAIKLTFTFAVAGGVNRECLLYHNQALNHIRVRMSSPEEATSEATLGAILLLAGIEARLSMPLQVQLHMNAIRHLLSICRTQGIQLTDGIKRAIFWQDLNSSVMTGSSRIVDHTTFAELQWRRDLFTPNAFILPPGFQQRSHLLSEDCIEVLKDIHALKCIRETANFGVDNASAMAQIDNHQASVQSRLAGWSNMSPFLHCCNLAAYLCSAVLRCKLWHDSVIPSHLSLQLLRQLQQANEDFVWNDHPDILVWLLHIGGAFASTATIRSDYILLLHVNYEPRFKSLYRSWSELLEILKRFIWSERVFLPEVKRLWEESDRRQYLFMAESRLFKPLKIGNVELKHRIGMPSLTRLRATDDRVPTPLMKEYYSQRASVPGTLIVVEGTFVSPACGGFTNGPGVWSNEQVEAWRTITDSVHRKGSFIFCQIFAMGRAADAEQARKEGFPVLAPSAIPFEGGAIPREMTVEEIKKSVQDFADAAKNAIRAGFDGVECHAANGYLIDQFIQDVSNKRDDSYGGSIENRSRFLDEVLQALVAAVGPEHVGLRLSPWSTFQGMRMAGPIPQFTDVINKARQANIAYLHLVESRISGAEDYNGRDSLDFAYKLWDGPFLIAGGYKPEEARKLVDTEHPDKDIVVMFGRYFISNPDLVFRIKEGLELSAYDRKTFYVYKSAAGYVDYPFSKEYLGKVKV
ncbi:putative N-ethylmaleimide reductase [Xylogone sp. PMI_703]|nr:putative N-ethylmaleimide reductase [Xylogone sp. PMI_703]